MSESRGKALRSRFTPSLMQEADLETLFVARENLLGMVAGRIDEAVVSDSRSHLVFVGPRGAGKTHLTSLNYYRAKRRDDFGARFALSWLPEDPWLVDSVDDFFASVVEHAEPSIDGDGPPERIIADWSRRHGPIVVFVENVDQILDAIGGEGQRRLRAFLENTNALLLMATSTRLLQPGEFAAQKKEGAATHRQESPFYGYLREVPLKPFTTDEAREMLTAIAHLDGDQELVGALGSTRGRSRLSVIEHLAGGQPRVWALLASGLSVHGLENLVAPLIDRFDDLTPYYQEQLARLSPHERKIVRALAKADHPMSVKRIAAATGIAERSAARTIVDLRSKGWAVPYDGALTEMLDKRLQMYELAEPLARLVFQIKESRGKPIQLAVDFLTAWFEPEEIDGVWSSSSVEADLDAALRDGRPAIELARDWATLISSDEWDHRERSDLFEQLLLRVDESLVLLASGDATSVMELPRSISRVIEEWMTMSSIGLLRLKLLCLSRADAARALQRAEDALASVNEEEKPEAWGYACVVYAGVGEKEAARRIAVELVESSETSIEALRRATRLLQELGAVELRDVVLAALVRKARSDAPDPETLARLYEESDSATDVLVKRDADRPALSFDLFVAVGSAVQYLLALELEADVHPERRSAASEEASRVRAAYRSAVGTMLRGGGGLPVTGDASARVVPFSDERG
ncbi:hypothetical protein [Rathayibacter sp. Leaf248]|uniref:hypothetical protein n=1 Tax=Rathayibacter sp. Leaf248 TaxID=2876555 RepID=UPI001E3019E4|nr:hypothetical protein [Rathayibacter sp. Leaf248]